MDGERVAISVRNEYFLSACELARKLALHVIFNHYFAKINYFRENSSTTPIPSSKNPQIARQAKPLFPVKWDGDNNHELCLDVIGTPQSVYFPAGYMKDPRKDLNPETTITIRK